MFSEQIPSPLLIVFSLFLLLCCFVPSALSCEPPSTIKEVDPAEARTFFQSTGMQVLTFLGYSGA